MQMYVYFYILLLFESYLVNILVLYCKPKTLFLI